MLLTRLTDMARHTCCCGMPWATHVHRGLPFARILCQCKPAIALLPTALQTYSYHSCRASRVPRHDGAASSTASDPPLSPAPSPSSATTAKSASAAGWARHSFAHVPWGPSQASVAVLGSSTLLLVDACGCSGGGTAHRSLWPMPVCSAVHVVLFSVQSRNELTSVYA